MAVEHPRVVRYLHEFDSAAEGLPLPRRRALRREIRSHLVEAVPVGLSDDDADRRIADFGPAEAIVEQERVGVVVASDPNSRGLSRRSVRLVVGVGSGVLVLTIAAVLILVSTRSAPVTSIVNAHPAGVARTTSGDAYFDYIDTIKAMKKPLPPGAVYPAGVQKGLNSGSTKDGLMEFGAGSVTAHFTWLCAWEAEYLDAVKAKSTQRKVAAERMLIWWGDSAWWHSADPDHGWNLNVIDPMKMGDSSGVRSDEQESCAQAGITG